MFKRMISTQIEIEAEAGRVWEALTDFPSYPEWNPMIRRAEGELKAGSRLRLRYEPAGHDGKNYRPKLLVVNPGNELRWLGNPWIPGLVRSEHYFLLQPLRGFRTRVGHGMFIKGLLAPFLRDMLQGTKGPFEEMNRALKNRSELNPTGKQTR